MRKCSAASRGRPASLSALARLLSASALPGQGAAVPLLGALGVLVAEMELDAAVQHPARLRLQLLVGIAHALGHAPVQWSPPKVNWLFDG